MHEVKVNQQFDFSIEQTPAGVTVNGTIVNPDVKQLGHNRWHVINELKSYNVELVSIDHSTKTAEIKVNNNTYTISAKDQFDLLLEKMGMNTVNASRISELKAPMPGLVLKVFVAEGAEVAKGDNLFIMEAMKMENIIKAPADVTVKTVKITPGDKVEKGQVLLQFA